MSELRTPRAKQTMASDAVKAAPAAKAAPAKAASAASVPQVIAAREPVPPSLKDGERVIACMALSSGARCKNPARHPIAYAGSTFHICTTHRGATQISLIAAPEGPQVAKVKRERKPRAAKVAAEVVASA